VDDLPPRRFVPPQALAFGLLQVGQQRGDLGERRDLALRYLHEAALDEVEGLPHLKEADHHLVVHVTARFEAPRAGGDRLHPEVAVHEVRPILAHILREARRPGGGPHRAQGIRLLRLEDPHPARARLHGRVAEERVEEFIEEAAVVADHRLDLRVLVGGDIPPYPTVDRDRVVNAVSGELLQEVEDLLPHLPREVEEGVEPELVGGDSRPEEVGMDPLQLSEDDPQVLGAGRDLDPRRPLHGEREGDGVGDRADAADSLGEVQGLDEVPLHPHELDPAVGEPGPDVHPPNSLPLDLECEPDRLLERWVDRANRDLVHLVRHPCPPTPRAASRVSPSPGRPSATGGLGTRRGGTRGRWTGSR